MNFKVEKIDYHNKRIKEHKESVTKFMRKLAESPLGKEIGFYIFNANELGRLHDRDKEKGGQNYWEYVDIDWLYYCKRAGKDPGFEYKPKYDEATKRHITLNPHHPEFWDENYQPKPTTDFDKRDSLTANSVDGSKMKTRYICEMCCDWAATGEERGNLGREWAEKVISTGRYRFSEPQVKLIYRIFDVLEPMSNT